ncbi:MAG TPA: helix-turn-helix transcriptional regulator [Prosthecobacter sp.]|nr:helix-turn-helix transcriptional regulator [Prosthecobacter sp.]
MNAIKYVRVNRLKINQTEMAMAARVTQATISRWEANKNSPTIEEVKRIMEAYPDLRPEEFFRTVEDEDRNEAADAPAMRPQ